MPALVPTDATESASALVPPDPSHSVWVPPGARSTSGASALVPPDPPVPHALPRAGPTWRGADPRSAWPRSLGPTVAPSADHGVTAPRSFVGTPVGRLTGRGRVAPRSARPDPPCPCPSPTLPEAPPGRWFPTGGGMGKHGHPRGFPHVKRARHCHGRSATVRRGRRPDASRREPGKRTLNYSNIQTVRKLLVIY